uniref:Uncharacterized protein n=1 Tax=Chromera velia CCMP2878 TaxID=1169474 RepID=A0A0G4HDC8_9ALVE|eukprot:Cvel_6351.t1-p1 / transcript=Cvel_6351.t1 / gene=Cvel_6351 / organism=Chromera_velia_CCMP2878 / gene_product=hypothetical protein / transcript_product=hypothetical protein / location=Cvel_scaffold309:4814-5528(-) / protein_length=83 / sequence_SO=supercontig / SO=protein_coding / is_pseudo=false
MSSLPFDARLRIAVSDFLKDAAFADAGSPKKPKPNKPDKPDKPDKPYKPDKPNKPLIFSNKPESSGETAERPIRNRLDVAALM